MRLSAPGASPAECVVSWPLAGVFATGHASGSIRVSRVVSTARGRRGVYEDVVECVGHTGGVARLLALPTPAHDGGGRPLSLVSVGADNRMRLWDIAAFAALPSSVSSPGGGGEPQPPPARKSFFSAPLSGAAAGAFPAPSAPLASFVAELVGGPAAAPVTSAIAFGPSLVMASAEHTVRMWRHNRREAVSGGGGPGSWRTLAPVAGLPTGAPQSALAASPVGGSGGGGLLVGGGVDGVVSLWDLGAPSPSGAALRVIPGYGSRVHTLLWLPPPDGRLVTGAIGRGEAVKFWDVRSGACTGAYALDSRLLASALLPDGRLVTGHEGGEVLLWDPRRGSRGTTLGWHTGAVTRVAVASDGRPVTGCAHGGSLVRVWHLGALSAAASGGGGAGGGAAASSGGAAAAPAPPRAHCATLVSPVGNARESLGDMSAMGDRCMLYTASSTPAGDDTAVFVWPLPEDLTEDAPQSKAAAADAIVWPQLAALQAAAAAATAPARQPVASAGSPAKQQAQAASGVPSPPPAQVQQPAQPSPPAGRAAPTAAAPRPTSSPSSFDPLNPFCVDNDGSGEVASAPAAAAVASPTPAAAPEAAAAAAQSPASAATAVAAAAAAAVAALEAAVRLRTAYADVADARAAAAASGSSAAGEGGALTDEPAVDEAGARLKSPAVAAVVTASLSPSPPPPDVSDHRAVSPPAAAAVVSTASADAAEPAKASPSRRRSSSTSSSGSDTTASSRGRESDSAAAAAAATAAASAAAAAAESAAAHGARLDAAVARLTAAQAAVAAAQAELAAAAAEVASAASAAAASARDAAAAGAAVVAAATAAHL